MRSDCRFRNSTCNGGSPPWGRRLTGLAFQNLLPYLVFLVLMLLIPAWRSGAEPEKEGTP